MSPSNWLNRACVHTLALSAAVLLTAFLPLQASAAGQDLLAAFVKARPHATGEFSQVVSNSKGEVRQRGNGNFAFSRPGKFRWEIQKPYPQLVLADGQSVVSYDPDMQHATKRPLGSAMDATPAALLFGQGDLNKLFSFKEEGSRGGLVWLAAKPKDKESLFDTVRIGFQGELPVRLEILDSLGQLTALELKAWDFSATPEASQFSFRPPPGVDLIETQ